MFGVLTTMATFIPIVNIPGPFGGFFAPMGYTVILALLFSLIESQLILPSHLAHRRAEASVGSGSTLQDRWLLLQARVSDSLQTLANRYYQPAVEYAIAWRYATLAMGIVVLAITASLFVSGRMTFQFFPPVEGTHLYAALTMPEGSPIEATSKAVARLEQTAEQLRAEVDATRDADEGSIINHVFSSIGSFIAKGSISGSGRAQSNLAEIGVELNMPTAGGNSPAAFPMPSSCPSPQRPLAQAPPSSSNCMARTSMSCARLRRNCAPRWRAITVSRMSATAFAPASRKCSLACCLKPATWGLPWRTWAGRCDRPSTATRRSGCSAARTISG
jgi:hypothetical protein